MGTAAILLHGYYSSPLYMKGIQLELEKLDLFDQILNLNVYDSLWGMFSMQYNLTTPILKVSDGITLEGTLVENVYNNLKDQVNRDIDIIHLIGHSMGGLIWRALIKSIIMPRGDKWLWDEKSPKIGSLTQLGTPNQGSNLTNMKITNAVDKIQTSLYLKLAGYSINLVNSLAEKFGIIDEYNHEEIREYPTQIQQMKPSSPFLEWLNSEPTYTDKIPHYAFVGNRNSLLFTNLAWLDIPDELKEEELIEEYKQNNPNKNFDEIVDSIQLPKIDDDEELKKQISDLDLEDNYKEKDDVLSNILKHFRKPNVMPNDGLVAVEEAKLDGAKFHVFDDINHWTICMWFLPFKKYKVVKEKVISTLLNEIDQTKTISFNK